MIIWKFQPFINYRNLKIFNPVNQPNAKSNSWQMRRWVLSCSYLEEKLSLLKVLAVLAVIYLETSLSPGEVKSSIQGQFPGLLLLLGITQKCHFGFGDYSWGSRLVGFFTKTNKQPVYLEVESTCFTVLRGQQSFLFTFLN